MATSLVVHTTEALTIVHNFIRTGRKITAEPAGSELVQLSVDDKHGEDLKTLAEKVRQYYEEGTRRSRRAA
ncbi:MAG: hypothetical protein GWN84_11505 [Gammaproteobacteria bacterium]|nr:hypothetical protein [Gammaproteobacteria bacterium]NIR83492.1 hypothetical protein [Gammaproteobacteria bacterium]NIR91414.1 hypothetical protein [Gammaproteobacteria bacterium]NIU04654.1 hypothetical protein [Gammaproteobacteria bacterium]NIV51696.1 hypothetical protein [Gammaproteobacteria bacterium]